MFADGVRRRKSAAAYDCFIHGPLVVACPLEQLVRCFTNSERDPPQAELFTTASDISDGWLTLSEWSGLSGRRAGAAPVSAMAGMDSGAPTVGPGPGQPGDTGKH